MRRVVVAVGLVSLATTGAARAAVLGMPRPEVSLSLVWFDPLKALPLAVEEVAQVVKECFLAVGVNVSWRVAAAGDPAGAEEVKLILLDGIHETHVGADVMGLVLPETASTTRAAWIFLGNVKRGLGIDQRSQSLTTWEMHDLAQALAHVIVHETVHTVVPWLPHASRGLMAGRQSRADLVRHASTLDTTSARAFLGQLAPDGSTTSTADTHRSDTRGIPH
jgi:hypothetical protein